MTDKSIYRNDAGAQYEALLAKVEAGDVDGQTPHCDLPTMLMLSAYSGSLDAAKALHEAVLPGQIAKLHMSSTNSRAVAGVKSGTNTDPARAWLIAILKALISEADEVGA